MIMMMAVHVIISIEHQSTHIPISCMVVLGISEKEGSSCGPSGKKGQEKGTVFCNR